MALDIEDNEPLLLASDEKPVSEHQQEHPAKFEPHRRAWHSFVLHGILISLYTTLTIVVILSARPSTNPCQHGPLKELNIRFKPRTYRNLTDHNPYTGPPSAQVDAAWDALLGDMNLRVSATELAQDHQESVALPEGGGHLAWLGAMHEIHCVKMLREWKYRDHYHPNISEVEYTHWDSHADHCLDLLRQTALCHADTSLTTFVWDPSKSKPMFDARSVTHTCVDWDALIASTTSRIVSMDEMGRLVNPLQQQQNDRPEG